MQLRARAKGETISPRFTKASARLTEEAAPAASVPLTATPGLAAALAVSDATTIWQHAIVVVPDRRRGYCLDENGRALMLMDVAEGLAPAERSRW
jgi:hypothetical protein